MYFVFRMIPSLLMLDNLWWTQK